MRRRTTVLLCLFTALTLAPAKTRKDIPTAPLPAVIVNATKVFLVNGGGSNLAFDAFFSAIKTWNKYEIVGDPGSADLIFELAYRVENAGTRVWSTSNTGDGTTQVHSRRIIDPQLTLTIFDGKTKNSLWADVDHRRLARREKNREKEMINSAERLAADLKTRATQ